jgi:ABC-type branched-subunit amino acid transport system ATPase component
MVRPKMLMLDEPLAGVAPALAHGLVERLRVLRDQGIGIGLIEHRVEFIHEVCDRVYAIAQGRVIAAGKPVDVFKSQHVVDAFLGVEL